MARGRIFVLDSEAHVYAFSTKNGAPLWDKRLAPKDGTDFPTLWGLLGTPNTIDPSQRFRRRRHDRRRKIVRVTTGFGRNLRA